MTKQEKINYILLDKNKSLPLNVNNKAIIKIKDLIKSNQLLYRIVMSIIFPISFNFFAAKKIFKYLSKKDIIINLGSGNKIIDESIINFDKYQYKNIDVAGDINNLPFKDDSVDGIICEQTLEHIKEPMVAIKEIARVTKKGGILCLATPFMFYYHESPDDYFRWTRSGLKLVLKKNNFKIIKFINLGGPAGAFYLSLSQLLAISLSFNIKQIYYILSYLFLAIFWPIQILDFIIGKYKFASNNAAVFLLFAKKY